MCNQTELECLVRKQVILTDFEIEQKANHVVSVRTFQLSVCCQNDISEMGCDYPVAFVCKANIASGSGMYLLH